MSESMLNETLEKIKDWDADFGGTEIYDPLENIFSDKSVQNYQKIIFLLTDGSVSYPEEIIKLIENNSLGIAL